MLSIHQKMKHKEELFHRKEQQRQINLLMSQEEFALKVKNKEINRERQKRKDDYQKELY